MKTQHLLCPNNCEDQQYFKASALKKHLENDCEEQLLICKDCYDCQFVRKANHVCFKGFFGQLTAMQQSWTVQSEDIK
jgi:hypothetical protein